MDPKNDIYPDMIDSTAINIMLIPGIFPFGNVTSQNSVKLIELRRDFLMRGLHLKENLIQ